MRTKDCVNKKHVKAPRGKKIHRLIFAQLRGNFIVLVLTDSTYNKTFKNRVNPICNCVRAFTLYKLEGWPARATFVTQYR